MDLFVPVIRLPGSDRVEACWIQATDQKGDALIHPERGFRVAIGLRYRLNNALNTYKYDISRENTRGHSRAGQKTSLRPSAQCTAIAVIQILRTQKGGQVNLLINAGGWGTLCYLDFEVSIAKVQMDLGGIWFFLPAYIRSRLTKDSCNSCCSCSCYH